MVMPCVTIKPFWDFVNWLRLKYSVPTVSNVPVQDDLDFWGGGYMKEPDGIDTSSQSPHPKEVSRPLDRIVKSLQPDPRT